MFVLRRNIGETHQIYFLFLTALDLAAHWLVAASESCSLVAVYGLLNAVASVAEHGFRVCGLQ